jgi:pimeloyl-ACP methyl ester carboxylesterase
MRRNPVRIDLGDVNLWFDVSGPSVLPHGDATERVQVIFYDQRGHGRSDHSSAEFWNLRTWADHLRRFCDALGLVKPVVLGSSFGGFVALTYAGFFPSHPGGVILANTTGGRSDDQRSAEIYRLLSGDEAAAAAERDFAG